MDKLKKHIYDENNGLHYTLAGDYYIPDLKLPEESRRGGTIMNFGYDEVSQTSVHITKSPDQKTGYAGIDRGRGIVSVHRMKAQFCDDCIRDILNTVEHQLIEEFFIFDTEKRTFYPIDEVIWILSTSMPHQLRRKPLRVYI